MNFKKHTLATLILLSLGITGCQIISKVDNSEVSISESLVQNTSDTTRVDFTEFVICNVFNLNDCPKVDKLGKLLKQMSSKQKESVTKSTEDNGVLEQEFDYYYINIQLKNALAFGYPIKSLYWFQGITGYVAQIKFEDLNAITELSKLFSVPPNGYIGQDNSIVAIHDSPYDHEDDSRYGVEQLPITLYDKHGKKLPKFKDSLNVFSLSTDECEPFKAILFDPLGRLIQVEHSYAGGTCPE